jgi:hypothetical protein
MIYINDKSGSNIDADHCSAKQIQNTPFQDIKFAGDDVVMVFDYAFGEQAYEVMDELLRPYEHKGEVYMMKVKSVSSWGKGILAGGKGDIMIPTSHIFEGTADNYPFENALKLDDFKDDELKL